MYSNWREEPPGGMGDKVRKTSIELPEALWRAAKIRAMDERTDFKAIVIAALEAYLKGKRL
jgi:hypothetical protein